MMKNVKASRAASHFFAALSALLLVAVVVCVSAFATIYRAAYFKDVCKRSSYYSAGMKNLTAKIAKIENQTVKLVTGAKDVSRSTSVMAKTINLAQLESAINSVIDTSYGVIKTPVANNRQSVENMFYEAVIKDCENKEISLSDDDKKIIASAAEKSADAYFETLNADAIENYCASVKKTEQTALITAVIGAVAVAIISIVHFKKKKTGAIKYFVYTLLSAGGALFLLPMLAIATGYISSLKLTTDPILALLISDYLSGIAGCFVIFGAGIIAAGFVTALIIYPRICEKDV